MIWTKLIKDLGFEVGLTKQVNAYKRLCRINLEINVVGQTVKKMILIDSEAMKMENSFLSLAME
jgi:hypothetical protein